MADIDKTSVPDFVPDLRGSRSLRSAGGIPPKGRAFRLTIQTGTKPRSAFPPAPA